MGSAPAHVAGAGRQRSQGDGLAPAVGAIDAEHAEMFAAVCEHAAAIVESARLLQVIASGEWLAEVPGHELDFWATGATQGAALKELLRVVSAILQKRLRGGHR